jgi:hypothetical protein
MNETAKLQKTRRFSMFDQTKSQTKRAGDRRPVSGHNVLYIKV